MADDPVVIDDGGSTRIKLFSGGVGEMDDLLDINAGQSTQLLTQRTNNGSVRVSFVDSSGLSGPQQAINVPFTDATPVVIRSGGNHQITLSRAENPIGSGIWELTITVAAANGKLSMEARQGSARRRYLVANAPPIDSVSVGANTVFDANTARTNGTYIIYTNVVVR